MKDQEGAKELIPGQPLPSGRLDLNLLPARHRPKRPSVASLLTWVLLIALLAMLLPAWQWFNQQALAYQTTATEAGQLAQALQGGTQGEDLDAMATEAAGLQARADELEAALAGVGLRRLTWSEALPQVLDHTPAGIAYIEIIDHGDTVVLEGSSIDEVLPLALVENLTGLGIFAGVRLEALDRLAVDESTPTPTATPRPRTTPTPTPEAHSAPEPGFHFVLTLLIAGGAP